jgi:hypothetical protein
VSCKNSAASVTMLSGKRDWWIFTALIKKFGQAVFTRLYWVNFGLSLAAQCLSTFRSFLDLGRRVGWWRISAYLSCYAALFVLCFFLPLYYLLDYAHRFRIDTCSPDGKFALMSYYSLWHLSSIFQISIGFGELSFSNAKLLDTIWDVVSDEK